MICKDVFMINKQTSAQKLLGVVWALTLTVKANEAGLISLIRELSGNLLRREINQVGIWSTSVGWVGYSIIVTQLQIPLSVFCSWCWGWVCLVARLGPTLCDPMDCRPPGSSLQGDSLGKNTGVGCHVLLQGIFLTQGLNLVLLCLGLDLCITLLFCRLASF